MQPVFLNRYAELRFYQRSCLLSISIDPDSSFHLKMWCIFLRNVLYNYDVFDILIAGSLVVPWRYGMDDYAPDVINSFQWLPSYGRSNDEMKAHLDFWYDQVFRKEEYRRYFGLEQSRKDLLLDVRSSKWPYMFFAFKLVFPNATSTDFLLSYKIFKKSL